MRSYCTRKLHNVVVTDKNLHYTGSIGIGEELLDAVKFDDGEKVLVVNLETGARFETYVIPAKGKKIVLNGAASRLAEVGDHLIIMAYEWLDLKDEFEQIVVLGEDDNNNFKILKNKFKIRKEN